VPAQVLVQVLAQLQGQEPGQQLELVLVQVPEPAQAQERLL
jgi:DNA-binding protein Fis